MSYISLLKKEQLPQLLSVSHTDWLLSTCNPANPDDDDWSKPSVHPCQQHYSSIVDSDMDYVDLLNCVQRHTRCSTAYCLRRKGENNKLQCRFKFPLPCEDKTTLNFEQIHTNNGTIKYRAKLITRRNDPRLNSHQRLQLQGWRANCDK